MMDGEDTTNVLAYTTRPEFTSEKFKIELSNMPKYYGVGEFKKFLNKKLNLHPTKVKTPKQSRLVYICFKNDEEKTAAIEILNNYEWKGQNLCATVAKPAPDPLVKRRNEETENDSCNNKRQKTLEESATDLVHLTYPEQLETKQKTMTDFLKSFANSVWREIFPMRDFIKKQREQYNGLPCELLNIKPSPQTDGYRNKCEFTIGKHADGSKVVGFRLGTYSSGSVEVNSAVPLKNISDIMKKVISCFEKFVRESTQLDVFDNELQTGHFKQLTIRTSNANNELMVIVGIHPQELSKDELDVFKLKLKEFFTDNDGKSLRVTSLFLQLMPKMKSGERPVEEHLFGTKYITEEIHGLKFRISPSAFFQVNTTCANILYQTAIDFASPTSSMTILDICCGTGTIGLCFAKHVKQVIGVESINEAIEDANANAFENNINNCIFYSGLAENYIQRMMIEANHNSEEIVAIVDPPRAGLHLSAIQALRGAKQLKRIVYISCAPEMAVRNFRDLMRPQSKSMKGDPFVPVKAVPIDMFPHTHHAELIVLFERISL